MATPKQRPKGSIYKTAKTGVYYFRYTIGTKRKCVSLGTTRLDEAQKIVEETYRPMIAAPTESVVAAHVQHAKGWNRKKTRLELSKMWEKYEDHPDRVRPKNLKTWKMIEIYLNDFLRWLSAKHPEVQYMDEVRDVDSFGEKLDRHIASEYADHLKKQPISVNTHNKRLSRIAVVFRTLSKYLEVGSPWDNPKLKRKPKEESAIKDHRSPFPKDKELEMFEALKPESSLRLLNKPEIEVLFYILKYTGQRQKDCAILSWKSINMKKRTLHVTQEKTGKKVLIPIADPLYEMLEKAKTWQENDFVLPKTAARYALNAADGTNVGVNLVNKQLLNVILHVGLTPSVTVPGRTKKMTVYGAHSFRHGFASHCAETNIPRAVCASILGADSAIIDNYYVHISEEAQRKAIASLTPSNTITPEDRISRTLDYIASLFQKSPELVTVAALLQNSD